jgi:hypothetical protein
MGPSQAGERPPKKWRSRKPLGDTPYFAFPYQLYDTGLARHLQKSAIVRYGTLLRVGNYHYGSDMIAADLRELEKLDGIAPRTAREINIRLQEYGMIQILKTRPFTYMLLRPGSWKPPKSHGPRIVQAKPLKVRDRELNPSGGFKD